MLTDEVTALALSQGDALIMQRNLPISADAPPR